MELPPEELHRVARIARLGLTPEEADAFAGELEAILEQFSALTDAVAPAEDASPAPGAAPPEEAATAGGALRDDAAAPCDADVADAIVEAFPRRDGRLLKAPRGL